ILGNPPRGGILPSLKNTLPHKRRFLTDGFCDELSFGYRLHELRQSARTSRWRSEYLQDVNAV
ncbi:MAG TPA: hypothetical protein PKK10_02785, partial [Woeseiaceae bacterium]|nr:hypothetical protein [Woeseiaceae bacterium]